MTQNYQKNTWLNLRTIGLVVLWLATLGAWKPSNGQVSGTQTLPGTYASFAAFVTDINTNGIGAGGVTLNISAGYTETAPAGGFVITATGTAANPIIIQKSGVGINPTFTAPNPQTSGNLNDGIIKIHGGDFITIRELTLLENAANTTTAAATNNMTEWGIALLYATSTDGCQNITIDGCTITLNRTYQNTWGIYANSTHSPTAVTTTASATGATGGNNNLTITGNNISNVNNGICVVGPTAAADHNNTLTIGGSAANANTITNFGTTGTFSGYANVSGTVNGILVRNTVNYSVTHNTITSSVGGTTAGTLRGVFVNSFSNAPTGTHSNAINNNNISLQSGVTTGAILGIVVETTTSTATSSLSISNNDFNTFGHTVVASGAITLISNAMAVLTTNINNNTFTNISVNTTGNFTFIGNNLARPANAICNVNNNSIVTAFNKTGNGGTIFFYDSFGTSPTTVTENNNGNNFSNVTLAGGTLNGWRSADGSPIINKNVSNNTFNNITISGGTGTIVILQVSYGDAASLATNNTISNITSSSSGSLVGLTSIAGSQVISNNTIHSISSTGATVNGLSITGGTTQTVARNKIYSISSSNTLGTVNGISVTGGTTVNIQNNVIGDLNATASTSTNAVRGIEMTNTGTCNVYYNTVYLNATSSSTTSFGTSCVSFSSVPASLDLRNNLLINLSTPAQAGLNNADNGQTAALRRSTAGTAGVVPANYATTSNNNLFFVNSALGTNNYLIYVEGTGTGTVNRMNTLAAMKAFMVNRDQLSVSENTTFASLVGSNANFLRPAAPTPATQAESGAVAITGVTDAYNGVGVRTGYPLGGQVNGGGFAPDIGAYEGDFTPADLTGPVITYTPLANSCTTGSRTLTASITDLSGVPTSGIGLPVLYWRINAGAYTPATATHLGGSNYQFTLGTGSVVGDVISYYIVAQDNIGNTSAFPSGAGGLTANPPAAATPPTTPSSYINSVSLSGVYTVGATGTYPTLTAAINAYNSACLTGAVTFSLIDATYPSETFPIVINANPTASATNTLTIKPAIGVSPTISGSSTNSIIRLNGADFVTIDGSNAVSGTTRNLTIINTNTSTSSFVIWNGSASASDGATNNTFRNLIVLGNASLTTFGGIFSGSGVTAGGAAEAPNNNLVVQNNSVAKAQYGIAIAGHSTGNTGNIVTQNSVGSNVTADRIGFIGMFFSNNNGLQVTNNTIFDIITTSNNPIGINIAANVINSTFNANEIRSVHYTGTNGYGGKGIAINTGNASSNITLSNNVISDIRGDSWTISIPDDCILGVRITGTTGGINLYFNSINLGSGTFAGNANGTFSSALYIAGTVTNLNIRNNILSSNLVNSNAAAAKTYAIYSAAPNTAFTVINFNNYFVSGTQGVLGFIGSDRTDLTGIQTGFGGNTNSVNINPNFTSATNLLPTNLAFNNAGTPISGITTDITGATRNATTPDMGAFEFDVACPTVTFTPAAGALPAGTVGTAYSQTISQTGLTGTLTWSISAGTLPAGLSINSSTGVISGTPTATGLSSFTVQVTDGICSATAAYSINVTCPTVTFTPVAGALPAGTVGVAYSQTISQTGLSSPTWSVSAGSLPAGLSLNATTGVISGTPTATGTFNFTIQATSGVCSATAAYSITVSCAGTSISPATLPNGTISTAYSQTLSVTGLSGTPTWSVSVGTLPTGLTLNATTGVISGTPTTLGSSTFTIQVTDGTCSASQAYTIVINPLCPAITVNPATLPNGTVGVSYNQTITATGGTAPYSFAVTSGSLPAGLTLNASTGVISGVVAAATTASFTITATDASANACTGNRAYTISFTPVSGAVIELTGDLDFGDVLVLQSAKRNLIIRNVGNAPLNVSDISLPPTVFRSDFLGTIAPGASQEVEVIFTPIATVLYTGNLVVVSNSVAGSNSITVRGRGINPTAIGANAATRIEAYPNPTQDKLFVKFENSHLGNYQITLTDMLGRSVRQSNAQISRSGQEVELNLQGLAEGMYLLQLDHAKGRTVLSVVKK